MTSLLELRIGCTLVQGTGWIRPVLLRADWPLGRLKVSRDGLSVSIVLLNGGVDIPWTAVTGITSGLFGPSIRYEIEGTTYELDLYGLFIQSRLMTFLAEQGITVPIKSTDSLRERSDISVRLTP